MRSKWFYVGLVLVAVAACAGTEDGEGVVEGDAAAREAVGGLQKNFAGLDYLQTIPGGLRDREGPSGSPRQDPVLLPLHALRSSLAGRLPSFAALGGLRDVPGGGRDGW